VHVSGQGVDRLRAAGLAVEVGVEAVAVAEQLRSYVHHRSTGRPFVTLKLAATIDGRTAAADGSSQWITGPLARADVHSLRAANDGILVGAGTVRADDPALTVRDAPGNDPRRYVLGAAPEDARVHPCTELSGDVAQVLERIGADGVLDLLVEGGATVASAFHAAGLVDRYVIYLAPAIMGDRGRPLIAGGGSDSIDDLWRGSITDVRLIGDDVRLEFTPDV
jgi:diaminohydroxyphosphoribosylaminopyrimidine deaminase/5-amino-6-(5-phosphoribosylamino)uracil reductase